MTMETLTSPRANPAEQSTAGQRDDAPAATASQPRRSRLDEVARRYYTPLLSYFRKRTRNPGDVHDLVQQVFLHLSRHPDIETVRHPDAYIFRTASNALKDHLRRGQLRERLADSLILTGEAADPASPDRVLQGREAMARIACALRELPERTRDVFVLRCFEGLTHAEIARLHGISERAVEKHFAKAIVYLAGTMERTT